MPSKRETLLEYLQNTLLPTVTAANGYNHTLVTIHRGLKNIRELDDSKFPAVFIPGVTEKRERITVDKFLGKLQVNLIGYVRNSKASPNADGTGIQLDLDRLIADLTKVIEADPLQGGRVFATEITDVTTDDGDLMPTAGCIIEVEFSYATEGTAP